MLGDGDPETRLALPERGTAPHEVLARLRSLRAKDPTHLWGGIYHASNTPLSELQREAHNDLTVKSSPARGS